MLFAFSVSVAWPMSAAAQVYNCPAYDTRCDAIENVLVGAALDLALRGPWVASGWQKPVPRIALGTAITGLYYAVRAYEEQGSPPYGFRYNWPNLGWTVVGVVVMEVLAFTAQRAWQAIQ